MAFSVSVSATESEVNVANNTSRLTVSLTLNSTYGSWFGDTKYGTIVIDGTSYGISYNFPSGTGSKNIGSASKVITHNAVGAYTAGWSYSIPTNSSQGTKSGSGSTTLTTIPRASTPTLNTSSINLGSSITINTNRASGSFTHTLRYSVGNKSGVIATGVGDKHTWTPPHGVNDSLAFAFPNSKSATVTITCETFNGNTSIGSKTCTFTLNTIDNDNYRPSIELRDSKTGLFNDKLLNGISGLTITANNSFKCGATLNSYSITGASKSSTKSALSFSPINVTMSSATTTLSFTGTVTDSRGYSKTSVAKTETVYRYNKPQIKSCNVYRCKSSTDTTASSNGTYAAVVITYTYQNDGYSNSMKVKQIKVNNKFYTLTTTETTSNGVVTGTGTTIVGEGALLITTSYPYTVTCTDMVGQSTAVTGSLPTADRIWDVRPQGKGLSVGKFAEHDNLVESAWEIKAPKFTATSTTTPNFVGTTSYTQVDNTEPDSQTQYYPNFTTGSGSQRERINTGASYFFKKGTASVQGETYLRLGNATASGTAGNKKGFIQLYGQNTGKAQLEYKNTTTSVTHTLPAITGTYEIQRAMAQIRYKRQNMTIGSAWTTVPLTSIESSMTLGSGLTIDSNKIKINNATIKKVKITASVISFGRNEAGDTGYAIRRVSSNSDITNILYSNYNPSYKWHAGNSVTILLDVSQNQTFAIGNWTNIATSCEHLGAWLVIEDITAY